MQDTTEFTFENTKRMIQTKDYRIQINDVGKGHPIFLIHGGGPGATAWSNFAPNVATLGKKFRAIAVTLPGWGESSPQGASTGRDPVKALKQLVDALDIDKVALVGNSMGGGAAIGFTAEHPERVSHLVTMGVGGPGLNILQQAGPTEGIRILVEAYKNCTPENMRRLVKIMCYDPSIASDELVEERTEAALRYPEHLKNFIDLLATGPMGVPLSAIPKLMASTVPTMAIHGRDDRCNHFEMSLRTLATIPNSRMVLINRCGHWAQLEHPAEFNRLVDDFVANH